MSPDRITRLLPRLIWRSLIGVTILIGLMIAIIGICDPSLIHKIRHPSMSAKTENYIWDVRTSGYPIDAKGSGTTAGGEDDNWMRDEKGEYIAFFLGGGGGPWGRGSQTLGGSKGGRVKPTSLPHAVRLSYYDYATDKFYRLNAVLPTEKIRQLMKQTVYDGLGDKPGIQQRYDTVEYSIGPQGYVVFWLSSYDASTRDQVEIGRYWAKEQLGQTVAEYNDNNGRRRGFPLVDRWFYLEHNVEPETLAKLKAGWTPDPNYYVRAEVKYPWTLSMTGNATLMSYQIFMANGEVSHVFPWQIPETLANPIWSAFPNIIQIFFVDKTGQWHWLSFEMYSQDRFGGHKTSDADLNPISNVFEEFFPDITLDTPQTTVPKSGFARIEVRMNDDLKGFEVQLVKGDKRVDLPVGQDSIVMSNEAPYTNYKGYAPTPAEVEWSKYGPHHSS